MKTPVAFAVAAVALVACGGNADPVGSSPATDPSGAAGAGGTVAGAAGSTATGGGGVVAGSGGAGAAVTTAGAGGEAGTGGTTAGTGGGPVLDASPDATDAEPDARIEPCSTEFSNSCNGDPIYGIGTCIGGTCQCGPNAFFDPRDGKCYTTVRCTVGQDQTCNADPSVSSYEGMCKPDRTCSCLPGFDKTYDGKCTKHFEQTTQCQTDDDCCLATGACGYVYLTSKTDQAGYQAYLTQMTAGTHMCPGCLPPQIDLRCIGGLCIGTSVPMTMGGPRNCGRYVAPDGGVTAAAPTRSASSTTAPASATIDAGVSIPDAATDAAVVQKTTWGCSG